MFVWNYEKGIVMDWLQDFHFLRPYWLAALVVPFLFLRYVFRNESVLSSWANVCDEHLLNFLLVKGKSRQRKLPYILATIIMFSTIVAISGPSWIKKQNQVLSVDNPVMIMINMSTDMWEEDISPNRIVRAEYVVKDLMKNLKSVETGLLIYSREPFVISPLSDDTALVDNLLSQLDNDIMPENGDRMDRAIDLAVDRMQAAGYNSGNLVILTADVGERFDGALDSAHKAAETGFDVNIIRVSSQNNEKLEMIAKQGNGIYLDYRQNLNVLAEKINNVYNKEMQQSENTQTVWEDMGYYVFWFPALLLLYYFRKGVLLGLAIIFLCTSTVEAGWLLNANQEALRHFENQDYGIAAQKFDIPEWKASAFYKNGEYDKAYTLFSENSDVTSLYNQGNALAKSGKIAEAIAKYEEVLEMAPDFEDARFNLEYLKKMQQQQPNNNDKENNQDSQNNEDSQNNQSAENSDDTKNNEQPKNSENEQNSNDSNKSEQDNIGQNDTGDSVQQENDKQSPKEEQQQNPKGSEGGNNNQNTDKNNQSSSPQNETDDANQEIQFQNQAMYGNTDDNSEQKAEELQIQVGEQDNNADEKLKARMQKFRDIPEDKGGLLKALINKEYRLRRYDNK